MNFLSAKGEVLDNLTDTQFAADLSTLDAQGIAPSTLSVKLASKPLEKCQFYTFFDILSSNISSTFLRFIYIGTRNECRILSQY